jgi:hypothetical protein
MSPTRYVQKVVEDFARLEAVSGCFNLLRNFHIYLSFFIILCFNSIRVCFKQYKYWL